MAEASKTWMIREAGTFKDIRTLYGEDNKRFFTLEIHHKGYFTPIPGHFYKNGEVITINFMDLDAFNIKYIDDLIEDVRCTCINILTTWKRGETMDYGITRLLYKKDAKKFKETVQNEGLHIPHQIYIESDPFCYQKVKVFYPETYKYAPKEKLVDMIKEYVDKKPGLLLYNYVDHFKYKYGVRLDDKVLKPAVDLANWRVIAYRGGDAYI